MASFLFSAVESGDVRRARETRWASRYMSIETSASWVRSGDHTRSSGGFSSSGNRVMWRVLGAPIAPLARGFYASWAHSAPPILSKEPQQ
ncbi:hypothetical protein [Nocardiopsis baichengensis]|uniref:hypothetical protein n=1 Tax=Nocardiopsis baichengensis TaxID=280240 RepID=UPI001268371F|nr:hypothetical protein [Nocardiopsis baichengensis]